MCRNIRPLFNFDPPATDDDVRAAALQFVRKISGYNAPSAANKEVFDRAVDDVSTAARSLLTSLQTPAAPKDRAVADARARERARARYVRIV
ncbi:MAG: DUF2277 domain-containing protein [Hyphomicrobiaceae bacterium]